MKDALTATLWRLVGRTEVIRLEECVHFGGWRYGGGSVNPYEDYCRGLAGGRPLHEVRAAFVDYLCHHRPRTFGEALGVPLSKAQALWDYPWARRRAPPAWVKSPADCPDILTHFSEVGIDAAKIEAEYAWLEGTFRSIASTGYEPHRHAGPPRVRVLEGEGGQRRYLVLDGNHRIAALGALGNASVEVRFVPLQTVRLAELHRWRGVRSGRWSADDARRLFLAYFSGHVGQPTTEVAARVVDGSQSEGVAP